MAVRKTFTVSVTPGQDTFIRDRLKSGRFSSVIKVMRASLRLLERDDATLGNSARTPETPDKVLSPDWAAEMALSSSRRAGEARWGALMQTHDCSASPIGVPKAWLQSLRIAPEPMQSSRRPMFVARAQTGG